MIKIYKTCFLLAAFVLIVFSSGCTTKKNDGFLKQDNLPGHRLEKYKHLIK